MVNNTFSLIAFIYCLMMLSLFTTASVTFTCKLKKRPDWINAFLVIVYFICFFWKVIDRGVTYFYLDDSVSQDVFDLIETVCIFFNYAGFYYLAFEARIVQTLIESQNADEFKRKIRTLKLLRILFISIYGFQTIVSAISIYYDVVLNDYDDQTLSILNIIGKVGVTITDSSVTAIITLFIIFYLKRKAESFEQQYTRFNGKEKCLIAWVFCVILFNITDIISGFILGIFYEQSDGYQMLFEIQMFIWYPFLDICNSVTFIYLSYCQNSSQFLRRLSSMHSSIDVARDTSQFKRFFTQYTKVSSSTEKLSNFDKLSSQYRNQSVNQSSDSINKLEDSNQEIKNSFADSHTIESISSSFGNYLFQMMNKKQQQQYIKKKSKKQQKNLNNFTIKETQE